MESLSDSEIFKGLKISSGAYSDAEDDKKFSKQGKNPGYLSETDSRKLERKVVQNHVRLEVSSSKRGTEQVKNQNNSSSCGNNSRLGIRSSLSPKMNTSDSELKVPRTENHRNHVMQNSHSDTESVSSDNNLLISPLNFGRGRSLSPVNGASPSVSRGRSPPAMASSLTDDAIAGGDLLTRGNSSMMTSISSSSVSRGNSSMMSSISPSSVSRGRSQLEFLRLAMNSKLPSPSQSSASDIDSDSRGSPDITRNKSLIDNLRLIGPSIENCGARPKVCNSYVSGQFDDSESDSGTCNVKRVMKGISVDGLLRNDPNMSITRSRLPKAAQSKVGMSSGSDTDCSRNFSSRNNFQQPKICSESDTDCEMRADPML
jgi:hypothetical protein